MLFAVRDLQAERVNLLMNDFAAGLPSPLAFLGLAAAVAPELGAPRWSIGVLPILHEVHPFQGRTKPEMKPKNGAGSTTFSPIETAEDLVGAVKVSMLLDIEACSSPQRVAAALLGLRLAGGAIGNERIEVRAMTPDGTAFRGVGRGYALIPPRTQGMDVTASGRPGELEAFAETLFPTDGRRRAGWFAPVAVGHRFLETPEEAPRRRNTRDPATPHVFTESLVGIAELVSVRNAWLTGLDADGLARLMWQWRSEGDRVVGHDFYHPHHRLPIEQERTDGTEEEAE